ncbi:hypothetical protein NLJ89_g7199 [Agrocybe chaxingu]|uniref:Sterigmatocystin biosynthesis monooxygenase stcW n=1 Tax=Agrocybe chaxingu TaxID=84603 RepID=A0A9W8JXM7_9AGAR|nr:hypothetical protein NLJ89_g7199 [Agrocybe chaxingu]
MPNDPRSPLVDHPRHLKPIHHERPLKVICIGAGASGLLLAYKLQRSFESFELILYEKNPVVSGTWYENKYPGCACDVASHTYTWSFEPSTKWSSVYAGSDEIFDYFKSFAEKYDLEKFCKFNHQVTKGRWDDVTAKWNLEITDLTDGKNVHDSCNILVNGCGILNAWRWPDIPGLEKYKGPLLHTANWDSRVNLTRKHVGLIGNGSSGIQVLPAIHPIVSKVTTFIRSPTWVSPSHNIVQHVYTEEEHREFETSPGALLRYRKMLESSLNNLFPMFIADSDVQKSMYEGMVQTMKDKLRDEALAQLVIPKWAVGCRRITPGPGYLETLASEKVQVVFGGIQEITERGCVSDGQEYPVDVLVCATGFDTSYQPRFPLIGLHDKNLADVWAEEPKAYFGIAAHGFPNYFTFLGPNSPVGNGPVLIGIEAQADYILKMIDRWQTENIHSLSPKAEAVEDFVAFKDSFMKQTVWEQGCKSWYKKGGIGKNVALWPGSTLHYLEAMAEPRFEDWDIKYTGNRFTFLGNGFSQTETDLTSDLAYYIRERDDSPFLSRGKRRKVATFSGTMEREGGLAEKQIVIPSLLPKFYL